MSHSFPGPACALAVLLLAAAAPAQQEEDPYRIPIEGEEELAEDVFDQELLDAKVAEITPRVERLRGWEFKHEVPAGVHTPEQFTEFAVATFEEELGWEALEEMGMAMRLFGLIEPETDLGETMLEVLEAAVGGYYDPQTGHFYMISTFNSGAMADVIMAHELTHALDDQYFDLAAMLEAVEGETDAQFAVTCVIEGSGTSLMNLYTLRGAMEGWLDPSSMMDADFMMEQMDAMSDAPPFLVVSLIAPYLEGNKFLTRESSLFAAAVKKPTDEDLKRAFSDPPRSSEQILHPEKYWDEETRDEPVAVVPPDRSVDLGDGWSLRSADTLGEFGCAFLVMKHRPTVQGVSLGVATFLDPASAGWGGDRFHLYAREDGETLLDWHTTWDSLEDAKEFHAAMNHRGRARAPMLRLLWREGRTVRAIFASEDAAAAVDRIAAVETP